MALGEPLPKQVFGHPWLLVGDGKMSKSTFQQKTKLMAKLFDSGCNTEKKLQQLDMESILKIPGITIPDMALIIELQKETKANKLFSYLGGGTDEQSGA